MFDRQLQIAACFIDGQLGAHFDLHALTQLERQQLGAVTPHGAAQLSVAILERKIQVAGTCPAQAGHFALHPAKREAAFELAADLSEKF
ncbi:hypothetical protein GCM10028811_06810 [Uliginosibacterium sediminicola]